MEAADLVPSGAREPSVRGSAAGRGGVTDKVLIQQLKELRADGVVARFDHREVPPRVEYSLTPFGRTLGKALMPLCEWGTRYFAEIERIFVRREAPQRAGTA
jgi:DNA-binding HxlR family transcriptional regulator